MVMPIGRPMPTAPAGRMQITGAPRPPMPKGPMPPGGRMPQIPQPPGMGGWEPPMPGGMPPPPNMPGMNWNQPQGGEQAASPAGGAMPGVGGADPGAPGGFGIIGWDGGPIYGQVAPGTQYDPATQQSQPTPFIDPATGRGGEGYVPSLIGSGTAPPIPGSGGRSGGGMGRRAGR